MPRSIASPPPPGQDASPSQGYPPAVCRQYPFTPGWRETKWRKVSCIRKQRDGRGLKRGPSDPNFELLTARPHAPPHALTCCNLRLLIILSAVRSAGVRIFGCCGSWWTSKSMAGLYRREKSGKLTLISSFISPPPPPLIAFFVQFNWGVDKLTIDKNIMCCHHFIALINLNTILGRKDRHPKQWIHRQQR